MKPAFEAFPIVASHEQIVHQRGMTLLDYFAGQAIVSLAVHEVWSSKAERCAARAYAIAHAMLEERARLGVK